MSPEGSGIMPRVFRKRTALEWAILLIALAAIGVVGTGLVVYGLSSESGPPELRVTVRPISREAAEHLVTVTNGGGTTAEEVVVEVTRGGQSEEVEFKAVAKGDREEAVVVLGGGGEPRGQVKSFKRP